jgi:hypothetical protein
VLALLESSRDAGLRTWHDTLRDSLRDVVSNVVMVSFFVICLLCSFLNALPCAPDTCANVAGGSYGARFYPILFLFCFALVNSLIFVEVMYQCDKVICNVTFCFGSVCLFLCLLCALVFCARPIECQGARSKVAREQKSSSAVAHGVHPSLSAKERN